MQRRAVPVPLTEPAALREGIVLLVEDDQDVRRTIRRKIAEVGFPIIEASSADEAWSLIEQISTVAYVVSDIVMPGEMNGVDLARRIQQAKLDIHVVLMSGKTDELSLSDQLPDVPFLKKPFEASALRESLAIAGSSGVLADGMTP